MVKSIGLPIFVVFNCMALSFPASADILYDNGPINGTITAWAIYAGQTVSDSFTLSAPSVVTGVTYGDWSNPGTPPSTVQWSIGAAPGDSDLGSGIGSLSNTFWGLSPAGLYSIYNSSFSVPGISLAAGTYYLTLQNGSPDPEYWDINDGPSAAFVNGGNVANTVVPGTDSESFQITGQSATVTPEPNLQIAGAALFACIGTGAFLRRRKTAAQPKR